MGSSKQKHIFLSFLTSSFRTTQTVIYHIHNTLNTMSDIISLQNLVGSVTGLKQAMEASHLYVLLHSNRTNLISSEYHLRNILLNKYSGFANNFRAELDEFEQLLLDNISAQQLEQQKEREKLEQDKLEIVSNNNLEIVDNLTEIDYSPAASITNEPKKEQQQNINNNSCSDVESVPVPKTKSIQSKSVNVAKKNSIKKNKKTSRKNAKPNKSKPAIKIN